MAGFGHGRTASSGSLPQAAFLNASIEDDPEESQLEVDAVAFARGQIQPFRALETVPGRVATFHAKWRVTKDEVIMFPSAALDPLDPIKLARAGFYYCPDSKRRDRCVCFKCKKALHTWAPEDNPLYEHCKWSPNCTYVQKISADNLDPGGPEAGPASSESVSSSDRNSTASVNSEWTLQNGCTWPKDTVIDHLLICVPGVAITEENLQNYIRTMRKNSTHVAKKYFLDRPMMLAVDAVDWHGCLDTQETMEQINLDSVKAIRDFTNGACMDVLHYTSPKYKYKMVEAVAHLINAKFKEYMNKYPKFTGKVSLFCHSLGSVIAFDLLWHQQKRRGYDRDSQMEEKDETDGWLWPQIEFDIDNLFAVGSPLAMFLAVRGDILSDTWPHGETNFVLPGGARLFNIFHPTDPFAYRFEPTLDPQHVEVAPALLPARGADRRGLRTDSNDLEDSMSTLEERIDYTIQKTGTADQYAQYLSSLTFASHWCYWEHRDIIFFVQDTIDRQLMSQDFFETESGRSWLHKCEHLLGKLTDDTAAEELLKKGELFLQGAGKELMNHFVQHDSGAIMDFVHRNRHSNPQAEKILKEGMEKREELLQQVFDDVSETIKKDETKKMIDEHRKGLHDRRSREVILGSLKSQVLDFLMQYLSKLEVPPIVGNKEFAAGRFSYALGSIVLSGVTIPSQNLIVTVVGRTMTIKATEVRAVLKNFTWIYRQKDVSWFKDHGSADAEVRGLSMWLSFDIEGLSSQNRNHVGLVDTNKDLEQKRHLEATNRVKIQHLDLKLHKAKASWLYNVLLSVFSPQVTAAVEEALTELLHNKIGQLSSAVLPRVEEYMEIAMKEKKEQADKKRAVAEAAAEAGAGEPSDPSNASGMPKPMNRSGSSRDILQGAGSFKGEISQTHRADLAAAAAAANRASVDLKGMQQGSWRASSSSMRNLTMKSKSFEIDTSSPQHQNKNVSVDTTNMDSPHASGLLQWALGNEVVFGGENGSNVLETCAQIVGDQTVSPVSMPEDRLDLSEISPLSEQPPSPAHSDPEKPWDDDQ